MRRDLDSIGDDSIRAIAARTREFIDEVVGPYEIRDAGSVNGRPESERVWLQAQARERDLFVPQLPIELGGKGIGITGQAVVFEESGYSLLGPVAMNLAAPDEGNMYLLERIATQEQVDQYLRPLAAGQTRSCFAMTEPSPGAGSDPSLLRTTATRVRSGWRIDGDKWFITGANGAAFAICMARTSGKASDRHGATMFLVDLDNPGVTNIRSIDTIDHGVFGGHSELRFNHCIVPEESVLGEVDRGFEQAQVRLAPARLTHCMRWLGLAQRAQDIAIDYVSRRRAFGSRLSDLGLAQHLIADSEIDLAACRALIATTAAGLSGPGSGRVETSIAKVFVAEAVNRVVDRAVQLCGALGISSDILLSRYLQEVRPFRIYDGPSETHRWTIAKHVVRNTSDGPV